MYIFLIVVHIVVSLILVLVILLQAGRGGGLSEAFGMGSTSTIFGTSASKFLQRATAACAIIFLITSLGLTVVSSYQSKSLMRVEQLKKVMSEVEKKGVPLPVPAPTEAKETEKTEEKKEEKPIEEETLPEE